MGRKPVLPQRRAAISKHAYLTSSQADWLASREIQFSGYVRSCIERDMAGDSEYLKGAAAQKIAQHDAEHQELLREFEAMTGGPIQASDLQAAAAKDEDPGARYCALWTFFAANRPDVCKTIMGTAYGKEIVGEKVLLELIDVQRDSFHIVDSPKRVLDELRQLEYSPGEQKADTEVVTGVLSRGHDAPPAAPEWMTKLRVALATIDAKKAASFLKAHGHDRLTEVSSAEAVAMIKELETE